MGTTQTALISSCRALVGDGPTDNLSRLENLNNQEIGNVLDGTNKQFALVNFPLTNAGTNKDGIVSLVVDGVVLAPTTGYVINDPTTGLITFVTAPANTAVASYYFYLMSDAAWLEFVTAALERINFSTGDVTTDLTTVPEPLVSCLKSYACANWAMRMSAQTSLWYNQHLQEREENRENISRKFLQLGQEYNKQGDEQLKLYYTGSGSDLRPAMRIINHTPREWTPYR